ncbi:MAG: 1,4-alpha-glucan branching protein GlgB [Verrucomicrobiota bacterium]|jgi:1,4-alpha-glucan branching enzyme|nr:1,4-alpha-glucan branching protein GlgB [Verrucomicrobiota bacterium]
MEPILSEPEINAIIYGMHGAPFSLLGMHETGASKPGVVIRAFRPYATKVELVRKDTGETVDMPRIHADGLYELFFPKTAPFAYALRLTWYDGTWTEMEDPYRFPLQLTDLDIYLHGEGTNFRSYQKLGAHVTTVEGVEGVHFAVWAPNAIRVSVVGWFNQWDGRIHPMQQRGNSGLWELFLPGLKQGDLYKFEVKGHDEYLAQKADPFAFAAELRPRTASMVWDVNAYAWTDQEWVERRRMRNWLEEAISVYEVHLGSWQRKAEDHNRVLTYRELAETLVPYVKKMGYTHIEMLPVSEHPFDGSWGYQTIGYYAPTSRFGSPDDFKYFVDRCHQEGIGVILDWVPAHFPKDGHGLAYFDGTHLYEHDDPRLGEHRDWGTYIFNYGRNEVRSFLLSNAVFWADVYHVDGLRVDAVASMLYLDYSRNEGEWLPNRFGGNENLEAVDFLKKFNERVHADYPGFLTFAEESTSWPMVSRPVYLGGLGFDLKWNMGWMHDTLDYMNKDPVFRKYHHQQMTFSMIYAFNENFILPFSHDEVVHGKGSMLSKMPGDMWQQFANLRLLYAYMFAHPGKKLTFMGMEFGQWREWNHDESLDWHLLEYDSHSGMQRLARDLNAVLKGFGCLHQTDFSWEGFEWVDLNDWENSTLFTLRKGKDPNELMVCGFNFTPVPRNSYRMGVPKMGTYEEILNTDATIYGGGGIGNPRFVKAEPVEWQSRAFSIPITVPPLGAIYFRYRPDMDAHI